MTGLLRRIGLTTAVLAAAACAPTPPPALPPPPVPPPAGWQACGDGFDCARVRVPIDYAQPSGATVELGLVRHRAGDPARRIGSLLVNPGGPGAPAAELVRLVATPASLFRPEVVARFDIVGMDPRGVGSSGQVECRDDAEREAKLAIDLDPRISGGLARPALEEEARDLAADCAARVDPALLGQLSTDVVARDMDQVRAAIGEERITYYGLSYGTLLGATYATLFPGRVRHMVLDAPIHPETWTHDPLRATLEQQVSAEAVLNRYFATCVAEGPACPFGAGRPAEAFDALVSRLEVAPLRVAPEGNIPEGRVDGAVLLFAARTAVFAPGLWPALTAALVTAERGDGRIAYRLSTALLRDPDGSLNGFPEANTAVTCLDRAVPADIGAHEGNAEQMRGAAPRFGTQLGYAFLACTVWPAPNPDRYLGPLNGSGAPPMLVIGGREDSQTPYPWAEAMARSMPGSVLLTRDGVGHGSARSGPCTDDAITRYLVDGELPAEGSVCSREPAPTTSPAALGG